MKDNPYHLPARTAALVATSLFSSEGTRIVGSLAFWMKLVGICYFAMGALAALFLQCSLDVGRAAGPGLARATGESWWVVAPSAIVLGIGAPVIAGIVASGVWLLRAADRFHHGVQHTNVADLGSGFVTLRKVLILFGVLGIVELAARLFVEVMT